MLRVQFFFVTFSPFSKLQGWQNYYYFTCKDHCIIKIWLLFKFWGYNYVRCSSLHTKLFWCIRHTSFSLMLTFRFCLMSLQFCFSYSWLGYWAGSWYINEEERVKQRSFEVRGVVSLYLKIFFHKYLSLSLCEYIHIIHCILFLLQWKALKCNPWGTMTRTRK